MKLHLENKNVWGSDKIPVVVSQIGGVASILAGVLMIAGFVLHPEGEEATFGTDPFWVPAHGLLWLAFTIALLGWIGLYLFQASRSGRLGVIAFVVIILGTSLASWIFSSDVTYVPVIAAESPTLFEKINTSSHILVWVASYPGSWAWSCLEFRSFRRGYFPAGLGFCLFSEPWASL